MKHPSEPAQILHEERLIQSQFMAKRINFHLADHDIFIPRDHLADRISRCQHNQAECNKTDSQKNENHLPKTHSNLFVCHTYHLHVGKIKARIGESLIHAKTR